MAFTRRPRAAIEVSGQPLNEHTPDAAKRAGIGMIFQEMSLVPTLTAAQNIFLNNEIKDGRRLDRRSRRRSAARPRAVRDARRRNRPEGPSQFPFRRAAPAHRDRQGDFAQRARPHSRRADDGALGRRGREAVRLSAQARVRGRRDHLCLASHGRDHADRGPRHHIARRTSCRDRADERADARQDHRVYHRPSLARLFRCEARAAPRAASRCWNCAASAVRASR